MAQVVVVVALVASGLVFTAGDLHDKGVLDTDGDGLFNQVEMSGWKTQHSSVFVTDPNNPDSDGDGLSDGEEAGALVNNAEFGTAYVGLSNPGVPDTDGDGVGDADEYFLDMDPQSRDSDSDGLLDNLELEFGSDPTLANPDDDSYTDKEEHDGGSDPLAYTLTAFEAGAATAAGGTFGDCESCARKAGIRDEQIQSVQYLAGHVASGVYLLGDARDLGANLWERDFPAAGLSAFGLVPVYGDSVKTVAMLKRFAKLGEPAARVVRGFVERLPWSKATQKTVLDKIFGSAKRLPSRLEGGPKTCVVYVGRSLTGSISYVGITSNIARRQAQHGGRFSIAPIEGASGLSRGACRAVEEALMKRGGLKADSGGLENKIHSISPKSDDYQEAVEYGESLLKVAGFTGL